MFFFAFQQDLQIDLKNMTGLLQSLENQKWECQNASQQQVDQIEAQQKEMEAMRLAITTLKVTKRGLSLITNFGFTSKKGNFFCQKPVNFHS